LVTWLTERVGVASRHEGLSSDFNVRVIDVSDLVETGGNDPGRLREKLKDAQNELALEYMTGYQPRRVIVVCDKGIVRSSMFALTLLVETGVKPEDALAKVVEKVGSQAINLDLMQDLQKATWKKRILVTGGTGFIGSHLIPVLAQHYQVISFPRAGLNLVDGPFELHRVVDEHKIDLIIHLAHPRNRNLLPSMPEALLMMRNVLEVCRVKKLPLIYLSGLNVFGDERNIDWISSDAPRVPSDLYGQTKYLCEQLAENYWLAHDVKTTILRASYVYGKGMDEDSVICKFMYKAQRNLPIIVHRYNNGCQVLDFLHVNDLVQAILLAVEQPGIGPFNIGTGIGTSTRELAEIILEATASKSVVQVVNVTGGGPRRVVNPAEAAKVLNWKSTIALRDGLKELR